MGIFSIFGNRKYKPSQPQTRRRFFGLNNGGTRINEDTAMTVSAFNRGVIYLSSQLAKMPWEVKDADKKSLPNDRVSKLLDLSPNPEMSSMSFRLYSIQTALIQGNSYAEIERDLIGRPVALWPILPGHCTPFRDDKNRLRYRVLGGAIDGSGGNVILRPRDVFHTKNLHTPDGLVGLGVVDYAKEILGITVGADIFANSLYSNGAMPTGVLTVPGGLSDEAFKRVKESWDESHGRRKIGGTAVMEEGMKYDPLSLAPDMLQFIDTRKFNVMEVARFLGVPPQKLYDGDSSTFKNIEQVNIQVANDTIDPWAKSLELEADIKLLNNRFGGKNSQFDLSNLNRGDMTTRSTYYKNMFAIGSINPNEIRNKEGESSYDGGDRYYISTNNFTPVDRQDEVIDSQLKKNEPQENKLEKALVDHFKKR